MIKDKSIIFMGTPDFAACSLEKIMKSGISVKAVITAPDRPAGRGQKVRFSAVKEKALEFDLPLLQPTNLKDETFVQSLKELNADLFVVVAFRMLPEVVWGMPALGTINLHGSLLPNYRGAAPINWAVINGEKETGVTTFFIEKEIDTGKVIEFAKTEITEEDNAGTVHDRLMLIGADLLVSSIQKIFKGEVNPIAQSDLIKGELKEAPKIFKEDCKIDWELPAEQVFNKIRGLSPYPAAWTQIQHKETGKIKGMKIFKTEQTNSKSSSGKIESNETVSVGCSDFYLRLAEVQLEGKKRMPVEDFKRGFNFDEWEILSA